MTSESGPPRVVLRRSDLERVVTPRDVIDALDAAFRASAVGEARVPLRTVVPAGELDTAVMRRARIVVETYDGVLGTTGDVMIPMQEGALTREMIAPISPKWSPARVPAGSIRRT